MSDTSIPPNGVEVDVVESREVWSEYQLQDGTKLRVRPILAGAFRVEGQWMPDGQPVYGVRMSFLIDARAPDTLKRPT